MPKSVQSPGHKLLLALLIVAAESLTACSLLPSKGLPPVNTAPIRTDGLGDSQRQIAEKMVSERRHLRGCIPGNSSSSGCEDLPPECKDLSQRDCLALLAIENRFATDYYTREESPFYPTSNEEKEAGTQDLDWPTGLPRTCLAMSGGGIRSASFNIGVLQGLSDAGVLDRVDIMSSVSGGSYANYWFHVHQLERRKTWSREKVPPAKTEDLLSNDGEYQKWLEDNKFVNSFWAGWTGFWGMAGKPVVSILDFLLLRTQVPSLSLANSAYWAPISITFGQSKGVRSVGHDVSFKRLRQGLEEARAEGQLVPFPIINATVTEGRGGACRSQDKLFDSVFEFTPLRFGSEGLGFSDELDWIDFAKAVTASGAATDDPKARHCRMMNTLGLRLGLRVRSYLPGPRLWDVRNAIAYQRESSRVIHLSDGGFSDNLGAYAAVKRACQTIIIVDAEHDPYLLFESYEKLKRALNSEMNVEIQVKEIDALIEERRERFPQSPEWPLDLGKIRRTVRESPGKYFKADELPEAVYQGTIGLFPYGSGEQNLKLNVIYVKLAMDQAILEKDGLEVAHEHWKNQRRLWEQRGRVSPDEPIGCYRSLLGPVCPFPQASTRDQNFDTEQFRSYRALGRYLGGLAGQKLTVLQSKKDHVEILFSPPTPPK